jgi:hypothetical protein
MASFGPETIRNKTVMECCVPRELEEPQGSIKGILNIPDEVKQV